MITVGDELLAGDTVNTNAAWLGRQLTQRGADIGRVIVIPDRIDAIAREVNQCRADYDAVIVTGGLGPTHDDVTMAGVGAAVGVPVEEHDDAVRWLEDHGEYSVSELVEGTADLPTGARMLPNEAGVAPGAVVTGDDGIPIYVLPGVPEEMKAMFDRIADEFDGQPRSREVLETDEPESALVDRLRETHERFGVSVGSYPGDGVTIKLEGTDPDTVEAAAAWLSDRLDQR